MLLDLDGNGVRITELSRSTVFMDSGDDGQLHRTAWAAAGDGVLFFDANGDGKIGETREYVFTEWDPTATGDLEALRAAFDSNGDGRLTAADAGFAKFKVMVTNADGSQTARTLAELGIVEIGLKGDATSIALPDGSVITGQASFTKADGTTGTVADVTLVADAEGRRVVQVESSTAQGARQVTSTAYEADGSIAYAITTVITRDGLHSVTLYDNDGDGVADLMQTIDTSVEANGSRTEALVNYEGNSFVTAAIINRTITTTSADKRTLTIQRDSTGGNWYDQLEVQVKSADGSQTNTIFNLARDGSVISSSTETVTAGGLVRTESLDLNGDGLIDSRTTDAFAQQGTERVNTVSVENRDGSLRTRSEERVSADGRAKTISSDANGDGVYETRKATTIALSATGTSTSTMTVLNADGSLRSKTVQTQSADTLTKTIKADVDGDGDYDTTTSHVTSTATNGTRTETNVVRNIDGSVRSMTKTTLAADKVTSTSWVDVNEDGVFQATDLVSSVTVDAATKARTDLEWARNYDGSYKAMSTTVTSADGLNATTRSDADGDGDIDSVTTDVTVKNADGTSTRTVTVTNADGSQRARNVTTVSADGLTKRTEADTQGSTAVDSVTITQLVKNADGSLTRTATLLAGNGTTLLSKSVTTQSADRLTTSTVIDSNGDGFTDLTTQTVVAASGSSTVTTQVLRPDGGLLARTVTSSDRSGLVKSSQVDANGDGTVETVVSDTTILNADGSRTRTADTNNGDGTNRVLSVTWVSDDGLQTTTKLDLTGDNVFDRSSSDITSFGADGSTVRSLQTSAASGRLLGSETTTTRDDGLVVTRVGDVDGDGTADSRVTTSITLNNNGSTVTEVKAEEQRVGSYAYTLRARSVSTVSDDHRNQKLEEDVNGDNVFDRVTTRIIADNGDTTDAVTERDAAGGLQSRSESVTSANHLSVLDRDDADGDGSYEQQTLSQAVLNADGSTLLTVTDMSSTGTAYRRESTLTSDDGTTVTYDLDREGNGSNDLHRVRTTVLDANGSVTSSMSEASGTGWVYHAETSYVSADRRSSSLTVDDNGDGRTDWRKTATVGADGVTTVAHEYFARTGALEARVTETSSADGRLRTETRDWDADGRAELTVRDETRLAADGGSSRDITFRDGNGILQARHAAWTSDDGLTVVRSLDNNGDGAIDSASRATTAYEVGGDVITTVEVRNGTNALVGTSSTRVSGNGLASNFEVSVDGAGGPDRTVTVQIAADGESTTVSKFFKTTGALAASETIYTRADGRYESHSIDDDGNGAADHTITTTTDLSRNVTETHADTNTAGIVTARVVLTTPANGQSQQMAIDTDGNGTTDILRSSVTSFLGQSGATAGNVTETVGSRTSYNALELKAGNGLSSTTYVDTDGNGRVDHITQSVTTYGDDGSVTDTRTQSYTDGSRKASEVRTESADGRNVTSEYDRNGDGTIDMREVQTRDAEGNRTATSTVFDAAGTAKSTSQTWDSADGLKTRVVRAGQIAGADPGTTAYRVTQENVTRSALGNGDYVWDNGITASQDIGQTQLRSVHSVDASGIETWTYSSALKLHEWREHDVQMWQEHDVQTWWVHDVQQWQTHEERVEKKRKETEWRWEQVREPLGHGEYRWYWTWVKYKVTYTWWETVTVGQWVTVQVGEWITTKEAGYVTVKVGEWYDQEVSSSSMAVLDSVTKAKILADADRIYDTLLDRAMYSEEREALVTKIANGALDATGLAQKLIASPEFATRFGVDGNAEFVSRLYLNTLSRAPTMGELATALNALTPPAGSSEEQKKTWTDQARAALAVSLANSSEHKVVGNELLATNNMDLDLSIPKSEVLLDRSEIRAMVERLFDTLVNRPPNEAELSIYMPRLLDESPGATRPRLDSVADILLKGAGEVKDLSVEDLVTRVLQNSFDRVPSASEVALWRDMINAGKLTKADFVAALSESPEHRGYLWGDLHGSAANDVLLGTAAGNALYGDAGQDSLFGLAGDDGLYGGADNDDLNGGTGNDRLDGGAGDDRLDGETGNDTMAGGTGNDTYVVDSAGDVVTENPNEGIDIVNASIGYALGANVEKLVLTGLAAITGTGNELDNTLTGNSASNVLDGGTGNDAMSGGLGDDTYVVESAGDTVIERPNEGNDTVRASVSHALSANVENLVLTGTAAIDGIGNSLNNSLTGNSAANVLDGGAGNDSMAGGQGDDTYVVDSAGDVVTEKANEGTDTVKSSIDYVLGANLENLVLIGAAIKATGNALANSLTGNLANNVLDGGAGSDSMAGGFGDDIYVVDSTGDVVIENGGEGTDTVKSSVTYGLSANVENLVLTGTAAINGTGNGLNNVLTGNSAANRLDGGAGDDRLDGGAGGDTMAGGTGDDSYVVDSASDVIIEGVNEGVDTVNTALSYVLGANLENLVLTGSAAVSGTGNDLNNVITGNAAANALLGGGGVDWLDGGRGNDSMAGGTGNDTYVVDATGDVVTEGLNEGLDTVRSSISYALGLNVENLVLTGTTAINGTGNALNNTMLGNGAANKLDGGAGDDWLDGGAGNDSMAGGVGNDIYVVDASGDVVVERAGEGTDTVQASVDYALTANVENLTLTGSAINGIGNDLANRIVGNAANNMLQGGGGDDVVDGGAGADTLVLSGRRADYSFERLDTATIRIVDSLLARDGTDIVSNIESVRFSDGMVAIDQLVPGRLTRIVGTPLADQLMGTSQNDVIYGLGSNDRLTGWSGADVLVGGDGDDTYVWNYGDGDDVIYETPQPAGSTLSLAGVNSSSVTVKWWGNGIATIYIPSSQAGRTDGGSIRVTPSTLGSIIFADTVWQGSDLHAKMIAASATSGRDVVCDFDGNDVLSGGRGDDLLLGGWGNDTFIWARGDGNDVIFESDPYYLRHGINSSIDTLVLRDISSQSVKFRIIKEGVYTQTLLIDVAPSSPGGSDGGSLTVRNFETSTQTRIEFYAFSDRVMSAADIIAIVASAASGHVIMGGYGDDRIVSGPGDDFLDGGSGDDTYEWSRGGGNDVIEDTGSSLSHGDKIILKGVTASQISVERVGEFATLRIAPSIPGGNDGGSVKLHLTSFFASYMSIQLDGTTWTWADLAAATSASEFIRADYGSSLLIGGTGDDYLRGGNGNDRYVWRRGDGNDVINENGLTTTDTLVLQGVTQAQLTALKYEDGVKLIIAPSNPLAADGGSVLVLPNRYEKFALEAIQLADRVMNTAEILALVASAPSSAGKGLPVHFATPRNDWLVGTSGDDTMSGGRGNDVLILGEGNDTVTWNRGDGNDLIVEDWNLYGDRLVLGGVTPGQVSVKISGNFDEFTVIAIADSSPGAGDGGTVELQYNTIETIVFANGVTWSNSDLRSFALADNATSGDDQIIAGFGLSSADVVMGGAGNDFMDAGDGDDTYVWYRGDGNDVIRDSGTYPSNSSGDTLQLKNISASQISFERGDASGDDLVVVVAPSSSGQNDGARLTIGSVAGWFGMGVENIVLVDATLRVADIAANLLASMTTPSNDLIAGFEGNDMLKGGDGHDALEGRNGDDVLIGGAGHDILTGGYGDDKFVFEQNFGFDVITDFSPGASAKDVIQLSLGAAYDSFAEVMAVASQVNADTVFDFGGLGSIVVQNVAVSAFQADDFLFAA